MVAQMRQTVSIAATAVGLCDVDNTASGELLVAVAIEFYINGTLCVESRDDVWDGGMPIKVVDIFEVGSELRIRHHILPGVEYVYLTFTVSSSKLIVIMWTESHILDLLSLCCDIGCDRIL